MAWGGQLPELPPLLIPMTAPHVMVARNGKEAISIQLQRIKNGPQRVEGAVTLLGQTPVRDIAREDHEIHTWQALEYLEQRLPHHPEE